MLRTVDGRERCRPENLADDGCVLEQALLVIGERVESRGDDSLHVLRQLALNLAAFREHPHELLGVQRIAAGAREQGGLRLRREYRAVEQCGDQPGRVVGAYSQWVMLQALCVKLSVLAHDFIPGTLRRTASRGTAG